jgi:hypothetical protein
VTDDILAILTGGRHIPELSLHVDPRGDLAAFWDGYGAGRAGDPLPKILDYRDPSVFKRAHARGRVLRNSLT